MLHKLARTAVSILLTIRCLTTWSIARGGELGTQPRLVSPEKRDATPVPLTLERTYKRPLPLGMRLDITPAVVVARDKAHRGMLLGYSGTLAFNAWRELFVVAGRVESRKYNEQCEAAWSVRFTLGRKLQPPAKAVAIHVLSRVRAVLGFVL